MREIAKSRTLREICLTSRDLSSKCLELKTQHSAVPEKIMRGRNPIQTPRAGSYFSATTNTSNEPGTITGRGRGCSAVAIGAAPNFAVTR